MYDAARVFYERVDAREVALGRRAQLEKLSAGRRVIRALGGGSAAGVEALHDGLGPFRGRVAPLVAYGVPRGLSRARARDTHIWRRRQQRGAVSPSSRLRKCQNHIRRVQGTAIQIHLEFS